ncbi:MAG: Holliday junction branch migration protein RuvA [Eubacterium sp.]
MISYIKGELVDVMEDKVIVENNNTGYNIFVPMSLISGLPSLGSEVKIYTYLYVREDAINLYGFLTKDDLAVFKLLLGVNGIGPKGALGILSTITPDDLRFAVLAGDSKTISKAPGIGSKTAQKLIIELKDKLKIEDTFEKNKNYDNVRMTDDARNEAVQALVALGYSATDAMKSVKNITVSDNDNVESILKQALKNIF